MTTPPRRDPAAQAGSRRQALAALRATEIVSYGVIYYAFAVLASPVAASTGWSRAAVTLAYSAGNLAGAIAGIPAGRLLHRYGPRTVMTTASVAGAASVAAIAAAPSYGWFLAAWLAAGTASAGLYYPPAFAALTAWYGPQRVSALTTLTLCAFAQYAALVNLVPLLEGRRLSPYLAAWGLGLGGAGQVAGGCATASWQHRGSAPGAGQRSSSAPEQPPRWSSDSCPARPRSCLPSRSSRARSGACSP